MIKHSRNCSFLRVPDVERRECSGTLRDAVGNAEVQGLDDYDYMETDDDEKSEYATAKSGASAGPDFEQDTCMGSDEGIASCSNDDPDNFYLLTHNSGASLPTGSGGTNDTESGSIQGPDDDMRDNRSESSTCSNLYTTPEADGIGSGDDNNLNGTGEAEIASNNSDTDNEDVAEFSVMELGRFIMRNNISDRETTKLLSFLLNAKFDSKLLPKNCKSLRGAINSFLGRSPTGERDLQSGKPLFTEYTFDNKRLGLLEYGIKKPIKFFLRDPLLGIKELLQTCSATDLAMRFEERRDENGDRYVLNRPSTS